MDTVKKKKEMLRQMEYTLSNISVSCKNVGISRQTHYDWVKSDKDYAQAISNLEEAGIDWAESKLKQQIEANHTTATIFYLKTKGKSRGYVEGLEVANYTPDKAPVWLNGKPIKE